MPAFDHNAIVPRETGANLEFREMIARRGYESKANAAALRGMCKRDPLFFINTFCWTANPMWHPNCPERPFIVYPYQEHGIHRMVSSLARAGRPEHLGNTDLAFYKARGTGASWLVLFFMLYRWMFFRSQSFLLVSRKADLVDKPKNMDALMPKLDFTVDRFPKWLKPKFSAHDRSDMKFYNPATRSIFNGETTTGEFSRGGRPTAILLDEFGFFDLADSFKALRAATGASFCCWYVSTTNGVGNAFHKLVSDRQVEIIDFKWTDMPAKRAGLYKSEDGKLISTDITYNYPANYPFILDGRERSPWYDAEERRTGMRSLMAQEHDRDFVGSGDPFFDTEKLEKLMGQTRPPTSVKHYRSNNGSKGELRLWMGPRSSKAPPLDRRYVVGADVSAGTGASNSCLCVFDCRLKEKVGELADPKLDPTELAEIADQVGQWFQDWTGAPAMVIWEANGPVGSSFGKRLLELDYGNLYYSASGLTPDERKNRTPGLWATGQRSQGLIRDYGVALETGAFVEPSADGLKECYDYRYFEGGKIAHYKQVTSEDSSGARDNHGDRVAANALALRGASTITEPAPDVRHATEPNYPCEYNEMVEHRQAMREQRSVDEGWLVG